MVFNLDENCIHSVGLLKYHALSKFVHSD